MASHGQDKEILLKIMCFVFEIFELVLNSKH